MDETVELGLEHDGARLPVWAWLVAAIAIAVAYLVTLENGTVLRAGTTMHELFHDGRHFFGVPCH